MPRKKHNPFAKLLQEAKRYQAQQKKARLKQKKQAQKLIGREVSHDYVAKWRALKKLGVIQTKAPPAAKNLSKSIKSKINKEFVALQKHTHYNKGQTTRPLVKNVETITRKKRDLKTGEWKTRVITKVHYELSPNFRKVKTKNKPNVKQSVIKTKTGYIVETEFGNSKVYVNKEGNVVENAYVGNKKLKITKQGVTGNEILKLADLIEKNQLKIPPKTALAFYHWGSPFPKQSYTDPADVAALIRRYESRMIPAEFEEWLDYTEIHAESIDF